MKLINLSQLNSILIAYLQENLETKRDAKVNLTALLILPAR